MHSNHLRLTIPLHESCLRERLRRFQYMVKTMSSRRVKLPTTKIMVVDAPVVGVLGGVGVDGR
jgi:hypothetical protein